MAVINLSIGSDTMYRCSANDTLDSAINEAYNRGVSVVVASGNSAFDHVRGNPVADRVFYAASALGDHSLVWLILGGLGGSFAQRFQDVQKNEESSFLPGSSESVRELMLAKRFPSGERFAAVTVVR